MFGVHKFFNVFGGFGRSSKACMNGVDAVY